MSCNSCKLYTVHLKADGFQQSVHGEFICGRKMFNRTNLFAIAAYKKS